MTSLVFSMVLAAAFMHASWNALVKARLEPIVAMTLLTLTAGLIGLPLLGILGLPRAAAWPYLAASLTLHLGYYLALAEAYRRGEMSEVYPIARGGAPLITALAAAVLLGETIPGHALAGVVLLAGGVLLISAGRRGVSGVGGGYGAVGFALLTAAIIAGYTVVDGTGGRLSGNPSGYAAALFVLDAVPLPVVAIVVRGRSLIAPMRSYLVQGFLGGALSLGGYWIAIWAMTRAPIPEVAALRETSVLISAGIATFALRERVRPLRWVAATAILLGIVLIRL
ncbi:MAG: EamA family transporter [Rhodospirillales bacterium]|nr:EamA family transporter [Rhodospirillales bacterium]